jgi:hypothetical protein
VPPSPEEVASKHRIDQLYTHYPFYGSRRTTVRLNRKGMIINRKAVQRQGDGHHRDLPRTGPEVNSFWKILRCETITNRFRITIVKRMKITGESEHGRMDENHFGHRYERA